MGPSFSQGHTLEIFLGASWGSCGASWGLLEASLEERVDIGVRAPRLGPLLGPSWAVLGAYWAVLAPFWAVLGASWETLELSWRFLGGPLGLSVTP
eukprot:2645428-Pyramimonas_sp.AAC.1